MESITPDVTIYLYSEEVKENADYTVTANIDDQYIKELPLGIYYFKVTGTYDGNPIAEEYKSISIMENKIIDWRGDEHYLESGQTIQDFIFTCYLAISTLTVNVSYNESAYLDATVEVGEVNENYHPREATHTTGGAYTVNNIKRNSIQPVKVIPSDSDTSLGTEIKDVQIGSGDKSIDIELFDYFMVQLLAYNIDGNRIYPASGSILDLEGNTITELSKTSSSSLISNKSIKKGDYIITIPGYTVPQTTNSYESYEGQHFIDKDNNTIMITMETGGESEEDPTPTPGA